MVDSPDEIPLRIREAVLRFCSEGRIREVKKYEACFTSAELEEFGYPDLSGSNKPEEAKHFDIRQTENRRRLNVAWKSVFLDLCARLERGEVMMTGVKMHPKPANERALIPGQWATEFKFDALKSTITFRFVRYLSVLVGQEGWFASEPALGPEPVNTEQDSNPPPPLTPKYLRTLSDQEVFDLVEEHARRVVEGADVPFFTGRISFMPIIKRKMLHRAQTGETRGSLKAEADELASWILTKIKSHQVPKAPGIRNALRDFYRPPKA